MSRVRLLSVRRRWAIVLALTVASFVVAQRASASVDGSCRPTSGSWFSQYDGVTLTTASSNQDPSAWTPRAAYACTYSKLWIGAKYAWGLHLQTTAKTALQGMLSTCST